jgi:4-alpha-glucanotransferase
MIKFCLLLLILFSSLEGIDIHILDRQQKLEMAIQHGKLVQVDDLKVLMIGEDRSKMGKAAPFVNNDASKNDAHLPFLTDGFRLKMSDFDEFHQSSIPPGLLRYTKAAKQWEHLGIKNHYGIDIPLFSLHRKNSLGCGEFLDLLPILEWCHEVGFDIIQMLPLNDCNNSPYAIYSVFALDLIYLSIEALPKVETISAYPSFREELREIGKRPRVEWDNVRIKKEIFLKKYFKEYFDEFSKDEAYKKFISESTWLDGYALFKILKRTISEGTVWQEWPDPIRMADPDTLTLLMIEFSEQVDFVRFIQFLCFQQLQKVRKEADKRGIHILGDLPFIPQKDSADVWLNQKLFFTQSSLGAPPDKFNANGQDWGLPVYNWPELVRTGYAWWLERVKYSVNFYSMYRLDHALGFFRMWHWRPLAPTIDVETTQLDYKRGYFFPSDPDKWTKQGIAFISILLEKFKEFPIAEDVGDYLPRVGTALRNLGVCGFRIFTDNLVYQNGAYRISFDEVPPQSIMTGSTHDSEPLNLWWVNHPKKAKALAAILGSEYHRRMQRDQLFNTLKKSFEAPSLLRINLLQEFINLADDLPSYNPLQEKINIPGTRSNLNWTFKMSASIEEIVNSENLKQNIRNLIAKKFYISTLKPHASQKELESIDTSAWYSTLKQFENFDVPLKDEYLKRLSEVEDLFAAIGNRPDHARQIEEKPLFITDVITQTILNNPTVIANSFKIMSAEGAYQKSKGPFDPDFLYDGLGIGSFDMQYPPQAIRTSMFGKEFISLLAYKDKFRSGAELSASILIDQNLNRLLPIFGPEPINNLNTTIITFQFNQPLLKNFRLNKDAIQEAVKYLSIYKVYYLFLNQLSENIQDSVNSYWDWIAALRFQDARRKSLIRVQQAYDMILTLQELQTIRPEDLSQIKGWLEQRKVAYITAENLANTSLQLLKNNMGLRTDANDPVENSYIWQPVAITEIEVDLTNLTNSTKKLVSLAKRNRYDILSSMVDQWIAYISLEGARNQLLPQLDVFLNVDFSDFTVQNKAKKYFSSISFPESTEKDISLGARFSTPFYRDEAKGLVQQAMATLNEAKYLTESLRQDAEKIVLDSLLKIGIEMNAIKYAQASEKKYERLINLEGKKINSGAIFAFIEFERRLNDSINDEISSFSSLMKSLTDLHFATGTLVHIDGQPIDPTIGKFPGTNQIWKGIK